MDKIALDFEDKDVVFYNLYTREPHAGQITRDGRDFSKIRQTKTQEERVDYALKMIKDENQVRPILVDTFDPECIQNVLGGRLPNSLIIIGKEGKLVFWQAWAKPDILRKELEKITAAKDAG